VHESQHRGGGQERHQQYVYPIQVRRQFAAV
jgi:hypothetical protein